MTTATIPRIGFACKLSEINSKGIAVSIPECNFRSTTISWLNRQSRDEAEQKLWELMEHNIEALRKAVTVIGNYDKSLRMYRVGSDLLPAYTHRDWSAFWQRPDVQAYCERNLAPIGDIARTADVRLSMHPGQFTVLASSNPGIVENSIKEFEYHADMARWMGYGKRFQDYKINVHISGRQGPEGIRAAYTKLSPEARNCITIENEEMNYGIESCLTLADTLPLVLDIHHHWIKTGEYIDPRDDRCKRVLDSWRGVRPTLHYSCSREDVLVGHLSSVRPHMDTLLAEGYKKQKLRAHSDFYWNTATNEWALTFLDDFDIMCESKRKNLASFELYKQWKK